MRAALVLTTALLCAAATGADANPFVDWFWPETPDSIECAVEYFKCRGNIAGFSDKEVASYEECAFRCRYVLDTHLDYVTQPCDVRHMTM